MPAPRPTDPGQATTEYALVLIGAAVIALLVAVQAWCLLVVSGYCGSITTDGN